MKPHKRSDTDRMLRGLAPPQPPAELRAQVVAAARTRLTAGATPDLWSRIWYNRGLRLAWAAAVILLLAGHLLTVSPRGIVNARSTAAPPADNRADVQFAEILRPVQISEDVQPIVGLFAAAGDPTDLEIGGNPS